MSKDIFKSLGITVGAPKLLDTKTEAQASEHTFNQPVRKGMGFNAADALNAQLAKGMAWAPQSVDQFPKPNVSAPHKKKTDHEGSLKNTHGENWHNDNDKQVEELLSSSEVIDVHEACKSLTQEELFLKAHRPIPRSTPSKVAPHQEKDPAQRKMEQKVRRDLGFKKSSAEMALDSLIQMDEDPFKGQEEMLANIHENSEGLVEKRVEKGGVGSGIKGHMSAAGLKPVGKNAWQGSGGGHDVHVEHKNGSISVDAFRSKVKNNDDAHVSSESFSDPSEAVSHIKKLLKKSELDEVVDMVKSDRFHPMAAPLIKAQPQTAADRAKIAAIGNPKKAKKSFVVAEGVGGMVFDFGHKTGNAIADRASDLLNRHSDPIQVGNADYQRNSYNDALKSYAKKGDLHTQEASPFGNIDKGWSSQLNKPMDQQVREMYEQEQISKDPSNPAVKNQFNETTLKVGSDVIKATSETDAAVLEMMRAQMEVPMGDDSLIADASAGGKQKVEITL